MLMFDYAYVLMCGLARLRSVMVQCAVCEYIIMLECSNVLMFEQIFSSGSIGGGRGKIAFPHIYVVIQFQFDPILLLF